MSNDNSNDHAPYLSVQNNVLRSRFGQILATILIANLIGLFNLVFLTESFNDDQLLKGVAAFLALFFSVVTSLFLIRIDRYQLSTNLFLWSHTIGLVYMHWLSGGLLADPIVTLYPAILVTAALIGNTRHFLLIFSFMVASIAGLSLLDSFGVNPNIPMELNFSHIIDACLIMLVSGVLAWQISKDYKLLLHRLYEENQRHKESRETFDYHAHHDPLTGLYNRAGWQVQLEELVERTNRSREKVVILFLDLDDFKSINDAYDHSAGDQVLQTLASRISGICHVDDVICRVSGDEFIVAARRGEDFQASSLAQSILSEVTRPLLLYGADRTVTVSIGLSEFPNDGDNLEDLHRKADLAMYKAKNAGKNSFYQYDEALGQEDISKTRIILGLRKALENDDLELHFQPRVNINTGNVQAVEALLRWKNNNPEGFMPDEFIPVIDATDLIVGIGRWVFQKACESCKQLHMAGYPDIKVSVNISYIQLSRQDLLKVIFDALKQADLAPHFLEIEIKEELLTSSDANLLAQLRKLKYMGVTLSIDDFGTGYSSLAYLTRFRVDRLKFDKPFIRKLNQSPENLAIVAAMIKMTHILGLKGTAEGIETLEELNMLKFLGCEDGQGYLWGKPLGLDELINQLNQDSFSRFSLEIRLPDRASVADVIRENLLPDAIGEAT